MAAYPSDETEAQTGDAMGSQEALRSADDRLIGPKKVARALGLADQGAGESGLQMARVFMRQELTCAALIALWLFFPADRGLAKGWLGLAAVLLAGQGLGVGMYRRPPGRRTWSLHLAIAVSLLGGAIYFSGTELSPVFLFYLWATAFASWYFPVRQVAAQVLWIVVSYAVVLVVHQDPGQAHWWQISNGDAVRWVLLAGTVTASALLLRTFRSMLADNEQRLLVAFERSATPMGLAGLNGRVLHANEAMGELLGRSSEELAGASVAELIHPADRERTLEFFASGQRARRVEERLLKADGTPVWVDVSASLVEDHRGHPKYYFTQMLDITARREAEHQAAAQSTRQAAIADIGHAAVQGAAIETLSEQVADVAAELLRLDAAVLVECQPGLARCRLLAAKGPWASDYAEVKAGSWPLVRSALTRGEPVAVEDWMTEERFHMTGVERRLEARSAVAVVVRGHPKPFGVLLGESKTPRKFTADEVNFLRGLSNAVAAAVEQQRAQEEVAHAATHDALTGLPNRALLMDLLRHSLAQRRRPGSEVAVAIIDLDRFGLVNESLGHELGDQLLRQIAARFSSVLRVWDTLARFTSDEFALICEELQNERAAIRVVERLLASLEEPFRIANELVTITGTVGITITGRDQSAESALRDAQAAVHRAKERSPGGYQLFDSEVHERTAGRLRTENALRRAIGSDELSIAYQPVVASRSRRIVGAEALLRWNHPDWGPVSPVEFIPIAEESGVIIPLGRFVLSEGMRQLGRWRAEGRTVQLGLNISSRQLYDDALVELTAAILRQTGLPAESVIFELTETALVADEEAALEVMQAIKELGIRLALDDYGTGWASLGYLSTFPFDVVKLDRTLIRTIEASRKDEIIVASTIEMGHALDLIVVAEGVETREQDAKLRELGCDLVQGYYHAHPMPPDELAGLPAWSDPTARVA